MSNFIFKFVDGNVVPSFMFLVSLELVVLRELDPLSSRSLSLFLFTPLLDVNSSQLASFESIART